MELLLRHKVKFLFAWSFIASIAWKKERWPHFDFKAKVASQLICK
jgi:hypothetical protein